MPITSHRDSFQDLTTFVCYGDLSFYEIVVAMKCFYEGIDALPTKKLLWDLRYASIASLSVDQISNIASLSIEYEDMMKGGKIALVASTDIDFGLARIYEAHTAGLHRNLMVFRTYEEATEWIEE